MKLKVTFLGTGTSHGVPPITCKGDICHSLDFRDHRLRTSIHIEANDKSIVVDTGPDFRQQVMRNRISKLDALLYTHQHKDHIAGMDEIRSFNYKQKGPIPIYAPQPVIEALKREFAYVFADEKYPGVPSVEIHRIENQPFQIEGIPFTPISVLHYKMPVFGYRIGDFTYITDCNYIPDAEYEKIRGTKILVLDALQHEPHISHFTLQEALDIIEDLQPEQAYLIHISFRMGLYQDTQKLLPANVSLAHDGLSIQV